MGKATKVSDKSMTVETAKKETKIVEITPETKVFRSGTPASFKELKVGDRVVVNAKKSGDKLQADVVRIGSAVNKGKHH